MCVKTIMQTDTRVFTSAIKVNARSWRSEAVEDITPTG